MKNITVSNNISIKESMEKLNQNGEKCLVVLDKDKKLLGTLSDGDLRKVISKGISIKKSIKNIFETAPTVLIHGQYSKSEAMKVFTEKRYDLIPIVNEKNILVDILLWGDFFQKKNQKNKKPLNIQTVIMAGGKGTRMEPFTKVLPKPLIPIQEKPIIEHIIDSFTEEGCKEFYLTVNYKSKILKAYFEELNPKYEITFIDEKKPLGTAGSLHFLKGQFSNAIFLTNCDIIAKVNYEKLYNFHKENNYDITLVASQKEYILPYGNCVLNPDGSLSHINEKPKYKFLVNTGLYVLNPNILNLIPEDKFYHITNLIEDAKSNDKNIGVFSINEDNWIDIGQWAEYKKAVEKF
jgi:dTDP-glucose pyrophosphorylase